MTRPDPRSCPPCHGDCSQSDRCPARLQSTADHPQLHHVLLALVVFLALVCVGMFWVALA